MNFFKFDILHSLVFITQYNYMMQNLSKSNLRLYSVINAKLKIYLATLSNLYEMCKIKNLNKYKNSDIFEISFKTTNFLTFFDLKMQNNKSNLFCKIKFIC